MDADERVTDSADHRMAHTDHSMVRDQKDGIATADWAAGMLEKCVK